MSIYRDLFKHSSIYALTEILGRLASILLLPLWTHYLTAADYGVIAIIDLTISILEFLASGSIANGVLRFYFDPVYKDSKHFLWTTGFTLLVAMAAPQIAIVYLLRGPISQATLGTSVESGSHYLSIALATLSVNLLWKYAGFYLRAQKKSLLNLGVVLPMLMLRIGMSIWFVAVLKMGILGQLYSGLTVGCLQAVAASVILFFGKPFRILPGVFFKLLAYGWPLVVNSLASLVMHQADRYFLRWLVGDMGQIGIYSLAYSIAQAANSLVITPFFSIWTALAFEVNELPERLEAFQRIFKYFILGLALLLLGVALFSRPVVAVMASEAFQAAGDYLPLLCLAIFFFPLHAFFRLPAIIHKKTSLVALTSVLAAIVNVLGNLILIPKFHLYGAAASSAITYFAFSFLGYKNYQRIEAIPFPIRFVFICVGGASLVLVTQRLLVPAHASIYIDTAVAALLWLLSFLFVAMGPARSLSQKVFARIHHRPLVKQKAPTRV